MVGNKNAKRITTESTELHRGSVVSLNLLSKYHQEIEQVSSLFLKGESNGRQ